jgi:hypothetical protein
MWWVGGGDWDSQAIGGEIARLKRDLLRIINVREFAPEAEFSNPCLSLVLAELACRHCNFCQDLDLCHDDCLEIQNGVSVRSVLRLARAALGPVCAAIPDA